MPLLSILFATSLFFAASPIDPSLALAARLARLSASASSTSPLCASPSSESPVSAIRLEAEPARDESPFSRSFARSN